MPPINATIAQQPRQKAKVWNAEFQQEDYRYENDSATQQNHRYSLTNAHRGSNPGLLQQRKASLPNYMYETGENYQHQTKQQNKFNDQESRESINHHHPHMYGSSPVDEEAFTSGYFSENNNNTEDGKNRSHEVILKPTSRERSYQEEVTIQKAIAIRGENNASPRVIVHKIYSQNGELFMQQDGNQEVVVNSMTISRDEDGNGNGAPVGNFMPNPQQQHLPRNHAMRSSLTIGVDASTVDAYTDLDRRVMFSDIKTRHILVCTLTGFVLIKWQEKQQWLNELEKQREEQRLRKMMEKEERRPRYLLKTLNC